MRANNVLKNRKVGPMRKIYFISFLLFSFSTAFAEQPVPVNISGGGAADLLNMNTTPAALQDSHANDDGVRHFCTDRYGRIVQQADPNYADCLHNKKPDPIAAKPTADERSAAKAAGAP